MSKLDKLIQNLKVEKTEVQPVKSNKTIIIILVAAVVCVGGYFAYKNLPQDNDIDVIDDNVVSVVSTVTKADKQYSKNLSKSMEKLAEFVKNGDVNNREQLKVNIRTLTENARISAYSTIDALDQKSIPQDSFEGKRDEVVSYLLEKAKGHLEASK